MCILLNRNQFSDAEIVFSRHKWLGGGKAPDLIDKVRGDRAFTGAIMPRHLAILLFATSCAIISQEDHQQRINALSEGDSDTDTDTDTDADTDTDTDADTDTDTHVPPAPPEVHEVRVLFRFDDFELFEGLQLAINMTDPNHDLTGGTVRIQGAETIPWSDVVPVTDSSVADNWYLVPIQTHVGALCSPPTPQVLEVVVTDQAGNHSPVTTVTADWNYQLHDESSITSFDECEPCVHGLTPTDMPYVVCGSKRPNAYIDYYDAVEIAVPGGSAPFEVVANYQHSQNLRLGLTYPPDYDHFIDVAATDNAYGQVLHVVPPPSLTVHEFSIDGGLYDYGEWIMFIQPELPTSEAQ